MARGLSRSAVDLLLSTIESPSGRVAGSVLDDFYPEDADTLRSSGFLVPDGHVTAAAPSLDPDDQVTEVSWSPDRGGYVRHDPDTGRAAVAAERLRMFRVDIPAVIGALLSRITLDRKPRSPRELSENILWEVDDLRIDGRPTRVATWFARRLSVPTEWQRVRAHMLQRPAPGLRIVLTSTPTSVLPVQVERLHSYICVADVLDYQAGLVVDPAILAARIKDPNGAADAVVSSSADCAVVTIRGFAHHFTGSKQRGIMRQLVQAYLDNTAPCLTAEVLLEAGYLPSVNTLAKAFSGRPDWRTFAAEEGGTCWLVV
jgi:hypothetical protein